MRSSFVQGRSPLYTATASSFGMIANFVRTSTGG
jgi:hypothetical protein